MTEELKAKARRIWEEIFPSGDVDGLAEVLAEDGIDHGARPDEPQGLAGAQQTMLWLRSVFSEQRWEIRQVVGEGDIVVVYCTLHGRHTGDLMGIPPKFTVDLGLDTDGLLPRPLAVATVILLLAVEGRQAG